MKAAGILLAILVLNFLLIHAAPGDPASVLAGEVGQADAQYMATIRHEFGLDKPLPVQLAVYVGNALRLDFGQSYREGRPVFDMIAERLPATLLLTFTSFVFALIVGVILGVIAARFAGRMPDFVISLVSLAFFAMPLFWTGLMAVLLFSVDLHWLPAYGMQTIGATFTPAQSILDLLRHLIMPAGTLGLFYLAVYVQMTRGAALEVMNEDFVRTARAKGVPNGRVWRAHILRNALLPITTLASLQAGQLVGGAVLTETVFAWPGIGRLAFDALTQRDYNVLLAIFLVSSALVIVCNLVADSLYVLIDPRIGATR